MRLCGRESSSPLLSLPTPSPSCPFRLADDSYLHEELSWSISKVDDELTPIVQRIAQRGRGAVPRQGTLLPFFDHSAAKGTSFAPRRSTTANASKRLLAAIKEFRDAEARAAGQDPTGFGEMLAGVEPVPAKKKSVSKRASGAKSADSSMADTEEGKTKGRAKRTRKRASNGDADAEAEDGGDEGEGSQKRRAPRRRASARSTEAEDGAEDEYAPGPKRRRADRVVVEL